MSSRDFVILAHHALRCMMNHYWLIALFLCLQSIFTLLMVPNYRLLKLVPSLQLHLLDDSFAFSPPKCLCVQKPSLILLSVRRLTMPGFHVSFSSSNCIVQNNFQRSILGQVVNLKDCIKWNNSFQLLSHQLLHQPLHLLAPFIVWCSKIGDISVTRLKHLCEAMLSLSKKKKKLIVLDVICLNIQHYQFKIVPLHILLLLILYILTSGGLRSSQSQHNLNA